MKILSRQYLPNGIIDEIEKNNKHVKNSKKVYLWNSIIFSIVQKNTFFTCLNLKLASLYRIVIYFWSAIESPFDQFNQA